MNKHYKIQISLVIVALLFLIITGCKKTEESPTEPVFYFENNKIISKYSSGFGSQIVTDKNHVLISSYFSVYIFKFNDQDIELIQTIEFNKEFTILKMAVNNSTLALGITGYDGNKVLIYERNDDSWKLSQEILGETNGDSFGINVDIDEDFMVIGAPAQSIYGGSISEGKVYIYQKVSEGWTLDNEFSAEEPEIGDLFGNSLAIHNEFIIAGSYWTKGHLYKYNNTWSLSRIDTIAPSALFHTDSSFMYFDKRLNLRSFTLEPDGSFIYHPINLNIGGEIVVAFGLKESYALYSSRSSNTCYLLKYINNKWSKESEFYPDYGESCTFYGLAFAGDYVILGGESLDISGTSYVYFRKYK